MKNLETIYEEIIWYLLDLLEEEHMGMEVETIELIKEKFDIELEKYRKK